MHGEILSVVRTHRPVSLTHALIVYIVPCVTPDTTRLPDAPIRNNKVNPNVKMIPEQKPLQTKNPLQWKVELLAGHKPQTKTLTGADDGPGRVPPVKR